MKPSLATMFCGVALEHPLMNAAGTCKTIEQFEKMVRSAVSGVVVGSITMESRPGNPAPAYANGGFYSLNSLGLPNPGADYYREHLPAMKELADEAGKPLIVSVAGFNAEEYVELVELCREAGVEYVELNVGCPNVWGDDGQKRIISFYPEMLENILTDLTGYDPAVKLGVKLSPFSNPEQLEEVVCVLPVVPEVKFVTTSNTFPNAFMFAGNGHSEISVEYAGMAGLALKPVALGQVKRLSELLAEMKFGEGIDVVGAGGIFRSKDILDYRNAGADAVQAATVYWNANEDPGAYGDVLTDADQYFKIEQTA